LASNRQLKTENFSRQRLSNGKLTELSPGAHQILTRVSDNPSVLEIANHKERTMYTAVPSESSNFWPKRCVVILGKAMAVAIIGAPLAAMLFPGFGRSADNLFRAGRSTPSLQSFASGPALNPISFQRSAK
jgi:hypothetical protein